MKLIIDIPEDMYQTFHNTQPRMGDTGMDSICQAIGSGIPLDKIRAEMVEQAEEWKSYNPNSVVYQNIANGLYRAANIIDHYIHGERECRQVHGRK